MFRVHLRDAYTISKNPHLPKFLLQIDENVTDISIPPRRDYKFSQFS